MAKKNLEVNYQFITDRPKQEIEDRLSKVFGFIFAEVEKNEMKQRMEQGWKFRKANNIKQS